MTKEQEMNDMLQSIKKVVDAIAQSKFTPAEFNQVITTLGFLGVMAQSIEKEITNV